MSTTDKELKTRIIDILKTYIGTQMIAFLYHDVTPKEQLTTNRNGIDIIAHQLELKFIGKTSLFISWENIANWQTYSLAVSIKSFCSQSEIFMKNDGNWECVVGQKLKRFDIYGYKTKNYEPHLLVLEFSSGNKLGIANFYFEEDFIPKYSNGDDVWIIFGDNNLDTCIKVLNLENLSE
jgi:hypothetical protein